MNQPKSMSELDDDLCKYCPLDELQRGARGYNVMCEGSRCPEAYERYLEDFSAGPDQPTKSDQQEG